MYRGGAEQKIRKYLIDNNYIDAIIQMPENLFFGVSISVCLMILKKNKSSNDTLFIDASKECIKVTNANKLTDMNIENIVSLFVSRENIDYISTVVPNETIGNDEYNYDLQVATYVSPEEEPPVDIEVINASINRSVEESNELRKAIDSIITRLEAK